MTTPSQTPATITSITDHDEPVVVDNAPVRIDFGDRAGHPTTSSNGGKRWSRAFTKALHYLVVLSEDTNGQRQRHRMISHLEGDPVTMTLARSSDPSVVEMLTFEVVPDGRGFRIEMASQGNPFAQEGANKGRIKHGVFDDLRLKKVAIGDDEISFFDEGNRQFLHEKVTIVLAAVPE